MPSEEFLQRPGSIWEQTSFEGKALPDLRREMDRRVMEELVPPEGITVEAGDCGGVPGRWVHPEVESDRVLYYIHGGGFTLGSSGIPIPFLIEMAHRLGIHCFSVDYRLAPEYPFPAAPEDCLAAYRGLLELGYAPERIAAAGESAGATLSLVLLHQCREAGLPYPACVGAMSPVTDGRPKVVRESKKVLEGLPDTDGVWAQYAPGADLADPRISPALGDLTGFPPVYLVAGGAEPLAVDSLIYLQNALSAGMDVTCKLGKDMIHTYPLDFRDYPEAMEAFEELERFFRLRLGR